MSWKKGQWKIICSLCNEEKDASEYYLHSNNKPRKQCKICYNKKAKSKTKEQIVKVTKKYRETHKELVRLRSNNWRINNLKYDAFRAALYRARKSRQTPNWANVEKIKEIYLNCPKGFHVDHIVPLKGNIVSGLHVEYNLQYLPAIDNIIKRNIYHDMA